MDCCICHVEWASGEYEELDDDEKAQCNLCKICNSFVCISCRFEWEKTLDNQVKCFECPICRNMDWRHYYEEEVIWWIKHKSLDISYIDDKIIKIYYDKDIFPPPIYKYIEKMND